MVTDSLRRARIAATRLRPIANEALIRLSAADVPPITSGVSWNDFSNMNGGAFPKHSNHRNGIDIDGTYAGYSNRDGVSAIKMLEFLNQHGKKIDEVFVAYTEAINNPFWNAIKNVTLQDGRAAIAVIRPDPGHATHFHWRLNPDLLQ